MRLSIVVMFSVATTAAWSADAPAAAADVERGRAVVLGDAAGLPAGAACHTCHGLNGTGDSSGAFPRIGGQAARYLYKQLEDYASGSRRNAVMAPIAKALDERQKQDVSAFYATQTASGPAPARSADPELLQRGGTLAVRGSAEKEVPACGNCHGPAGRGLPPTYPYLAGQYAPYIALQFRSFRNGARRNDMLGTMRHIAGRLSEEDIRALASYFASLPPPGVDQQAAVRP